MNPLSVFKFVASTAASLGSATIVGNFIKASMPAQTKLIAKIGIVVGGVAISSMVGDAVGNYVEREIDGLVQVKDSIKNASSLVKEQIAETKTALAEHREDSSAAE